MDPFRKGSIEGQCYWIQKRKLVQCTRDYDHVTAVRTQLRESIALSMLRSGDKLACRVGQILERYLPREHAANLHGLRVELLEIPWLRISMRNHVFVESPKESSQHKQIPYDSVIRLVYFIRNITGMDSDTVKFAVGLESPNKSIMARGGQAASNLMSYAEAKLGWIRVHGEFVSCYAWDEKVLKRIRQGLRHICERHAVIAEQQAWNVGVMSPAMRNYYDVPIFSMVSAEDLHRSLTLRSRGSHADS